MTPIFELTLIAPLKSELLMPLISSYLTLDKSRLKFQITSFAGPDYTLCGTWHSEGDIHNHQISSICAHPCIYLMDIWTRFINIVLHLQDKGAKNSP